MKQLPRFLATAACSVVLAAVAHGLTFEVHTNAKYDGADERGIAFDLINNSATETIRLEGVFGLPLTDSLVSSFRLYARVGSANNGANAIVKTDWFQVGNQVDGLTGTYDASVTPTFTPVDFGATLDILPGQTVALFFANQTGNSSFNYFNGTPPNNGATSADTLLSIVQQFGLGSGSTIPSAASYGTFGPKRSFVGSIDYTVIPEPSTWAAMIGAAALATVAVLRRRR